MREIARAQLGTDAACRKHSPQRHCFEGLEKLHARRRPLVNRDTIQDLEINGLKHELDQVQKLLAMVLCLVDPEDIAAALKIKNDGLTHDALLEMADDCTPPSDLFGVD
jgi:hypothetical protein